MPSTQHRVENINIEKLKELLNSGIYNEMYFEDAMRKSQSYTYAMKNYIANIKKPRIYEKGKFRKDTWGRDYCFYGIQSLPADIRKQVCRDYADIDFECCHPTCLTVLCRILNIEIPDILQEYVDNKAAIRRRIAQETQCTIEQVKRAICKATYGGKSEIMETSPWILEFYKMMQELAPRLINDEDLERCKKANEKVPDEDKKSETMLVFSALSERCCRVESQLLYAAEDYFANLGYEKLYMARMFDGVMLDLPQNNNRKITVEDLDNLMIYLEDRFAVSVGISCEYREIKIHNSKPRKAFDLEDVPNIAIDQNDPDAYSNWKTNWETVHEATKILDPPCFVIKLGDGSKVNYKKAALEDAFQHDCHLKEWLKDPEIQRKTRFGTYPRSEDCPNDVYNLWKPFAIHSWDRTDYVYDQGAVDLFIEHLKALTNYEANVFEFLMLWTAHIVQKPHCKPCVSPLMCSAQGVGKDLFIAMIAAIIGEDKVFESTAPENDVYGTYNPQMEQALIVHLSEVSKMNSKFHMGKIKSLITRDSLSIRDLYKSPFEMKSLHRFIACTNSENPMVNEEGQRRFVHFYSSSKYKGNVAYFQNLVNRVLNNRNGLISVYEYLMQVDGVPDRFVDVTPYLSSYQKDIQLETEEYHLRFLKHFLSEKIESRATRGLVDDAVLCIRSQALYSLFIDFLRDECNVMDNYSQTKFGLKLSTLCSLCRENREIIKKRSKQANVYQIQLKAFYERLCGGSN